MQLSLFLTQSLGPWARRQEDRNTARTTLLKAKAGELPAWSTGNTNSSTAIRRATEFIKKAGALCSPLAKGRCNKLT